MDHDATKQRLLDAIKSGEVLRVVYHGGSQPGTLRQIAPVALADDGLLLRARCYASNSIKEFALHKIVIVESDEQAATITPWQADFEPAHIGTLGNLFDASKAKFEAVGWHIEKDEHRLSLHRCLKNGKPLKSADVALNFEEFTFDLIVHADGQVHEENRRLRARPWVVRGKKKDTKTFSELDKAAAVFLDWAEELAPAR